MAKTNVKRTRKSYSVYRLERCDKGEDANSPDTVWRLVGTFKDESDCVVCKIILENVVEYEDSQFSIVRDIRLIEDKPITNRKIV